MPSKKQKNAPKKQTLNSVSQEEDTQIQQQLISYLQTATALSNSSNTSQAEAALVPITSLSENAQIVLLQALSREKTTEAADLLLAMHTFAPLKEARKEARRSLIRLEASRLYPQWIPPSPAAPVVLEETASTNPPRFWKGQITDTKAIGEMQLLLFWEQGNNYKEVRTVGFLLEFSYSGIKDFFTETGSKHHMENRIEHMRAQFGNIKLVDCTLADGKRLVEEALEVNQRFGTKPHVDYTRNLSLIHSLLLDTPDTGHEPKQSQDKMPQELRFDEARNLLDQLMTLELGPEETVAGFLDTWLRGDYEAAYTALAKNSPLREDLTAEEWVARRLTWAELAHPTQGKSEIAFRHDDDEDADDEDDDDNEITSPSALETEVTDTSPEVEAFWSLVLTDTEAGDRLKELPQATAVYKATGRHWFWTKYTLIREGSEWRILTMIDAGAQALSLPIEELQEQLAEIIEFAEEQLELVDALNDTELDDDDEVPDNNELDEVTDDDDDGDDDLTDLEFEELAEHFEEMMWVTTRAMHYTDALIAQISEDASLYDMGYDQATAIQENERAAVYAEMQAERFPTMRGEALRKLAMAQLNIAKTYEENNEIERSYTFIAEAEKTLRTSITIDNASFGSVLLAETLIAQKKQLDEAEQLLKHVLTLPDIDPKEATLAEAGLGHIAQEQEHYDQALQHYQRAVEISPDLPSMWFNIGLMQRQLGQLEEAEESHLRSIDEDPTETGSYIDLAGIYSDSNELDAAEEVLEEGIEMNPDAADLLAAMALVFINKGDLRHAKEYLDDAEEIDEELDIVQAVHRYYDEARKEQQQRSPKQKGKSRKFKKK